MLNTAGPQRRGASSGTRRRHRPPMLRRARRRNPTRPKNPEPLATGTQTWGARPRKRGPSLSGFRCIGPRSASSASTPSRPSGLAIEPPLLMVLASPVLAGDFGACHSFVNGLGAGGLPRRAGVWLAVGPRAASSAPPGTARARSPGGLRCWRIRSRGGWLGRRRAGSVIGRGLSKRSGRAGECGGSSER